jgi:serine/threonine protein phosphatase PrpC
MTHDVFVLSDVGCVRGHNEDDAVVLPDMQVYAVADGMGGHSSGEIASQLSVRAFGSAYRDSERRRQIKSEWKREQEDLGEDCVPSLDEYQLRQAVTLANETIFSHAARKPELGDMGTTLVALAFAESRVYVAFVGDSRAYRSRDGVLEQLTEDHSLANDLIRAKALKPEDLEAFPYKNVIVRALGLQAEVQVDSFHRATRPGDRYMLCSDGLSDLIRNDVIGDILGASKGAEATAEILVERAMDAGGNDNITVLVVDLHA